MKRSAALFASAWLATGCGYRPVHGGEPSERFAVVLASTNVPDAVASDEVVAGLRDELSRMGALAAGDGYPRCEVEVLRTDESSEGVGSVDNGSGVHIPNARATRVGVVGRAWIVRAKDGPRERDTADVKTSDVVAVANDARAATFRQIDSVRAVSRRLGRTLGARVMGLPTASE